MMGKPIEKPSEWHLKSVLQQAIHRLIAAQCATPRLDAEVMLAHLLQRDRSWLYAHNMDELSPEVARQFEQAVQRRMQREPVAYITGQREFYGLSFEVTPDVLIPRPETEHLIEEALTRLTMPAPRVIDIGTGSGCIAVTLAAHRPNAFVIATDYSAAALRVARRNARRHNVTGNVALVQADLLAGFCRPVTMIVSNPPYITAAEMPTLSPEVQRYEPPAALTDNAYGLSIIERLLIEAPPLLRPGGILLIEFGADQGPQIQQLARTHCPNARSTIKPDLAGRDRLLVLVS